MNSSSDASGKLTDHALLPPLRDATRDAVRAAAVGAWPILRSWGRFAKRPSQSVRAAAVGSASLTSESTLKACAMRHPSHNVRRAALANPNLTDQVFLALIARGRTRYTCAAPQSGGSDIRSAPEPPWMIRLSAGPPGRASNPAMRDDAVFADLAKGDAELQVRESALARTSDPYSVDRSRPM